MKKVSLLPLDISNAPALAQLADNRKIWDNVRDYFPHPYKLEDAEAFIKAKVQESPQLTFAIHYDHNFCGVIGLERQKDVYRYNAEVGYWLGEPFWGKGIAAAAVKLIARYAFEDLDLRRLYAGIFAYNKASCRVLEKAGFGLERIISEGVFKNGRFVESLEYGLNKANWISEKSV